MYGEITEDYVTLLPQDPLPVWIPGNPLLEIRAFRAVHEPDRCPD
jgi:hypothetical protein